MLKRWCRRKRCCSGAEVVLKRCWRQKRCLSGADVVVKAEAVLVLKRR